MENSWITGYQDGDCEDGCEDLHRLQRLLKNNAGILTIGASEDVFPTCVETIRINPTCSTTEVWKTVCGRTIRCAGFGLERMAL
jgi:hypothetical protein